MHIHYCVIWTNVGILNMYCEDLNKKYRMQQLWLRGFAIICSFFPLQLTLSFTGTLAFCSSWKVGCSWSIRGSETSLGYFRTVLWRTLHLVRSFLMILCMFRLLCEAISLKVDVFRCMLHNFAGNIEMYGFVDSVGSGPIDARLSENSTMASPSNQTSVFFCSGASSLSSYLFPISLS